MNDPIVAISASGADLDPEIHGAKACGLQSLMRDGLLVPPAFVLTMETAAMVAAGDQVDGLQEALAALLAVASEISDDPDTRLAVRSGAAVSLPGAFETILDVLPDVLDAAVATVVSSSRSLRAMAIAGALGHLTVPATAVIVQLQIDATSDELSGSGAATSRDLITGEPGPAGSLAWRTKGDAVMAGTVPVVSLEDLGQRCPEAMRCLQADLHRLEIDRGCPVEVEFAVVTGRLWYLQVRNLAEPEVIDPVTLPVGTTIVGTGRPASPGAGSGRLVTSVDDALELIDVGESVVLALDTTSPSEVDAMVGSAAVFTAIGSPECHAAVIARSAGVPAVVSVQGLVIAGDHVVIGRHRIEVGSEVTVDGSSGIVASATVDA